MKKKKDNKTKRGSRRDGKMTHADDVLASCSVEGRKGKISRELLVSHLSPHRVVVDKKEKRNFRLQFTEGITGETERDSLQSFSSVCTSGQR